MTLAQARALCPGLVHAAYQPAQDERALCALARWMMRYSPVVSPAPPDGVYVDVGGTERVHGGLRPLLTRVANAMQRMGITARLAIAPTPGAAWAVASAGGGDEGRVVTPEGLTEALSPLPVDALRLDADTSAVLSQLGVRTIAQLMELPREMLPARFGDKLLRRLDAALGRIPDPLTPLAHGFTIEAAMEFDGEVSSLEALSQVFTHLVRQIVARLARHGCGARQIRVEFRRAYAPPILKLVRLSRPSRDPVGIFNLLRCSFETVESDDGFTAIRLTVPVFERLAEEQSLLLGQAERDGETELARLIERLHARLGDGSVEAAELVESHLPERACRYVDAVGDRLATRRATARKAGTDTDPADTHKPCAPRPLRLLPTPVEVGVIVAPSEDREGRPVSFTHHREVHPLTYALGPERIAGPWWEGRDKTRDYFEVEDETGRRFWLFRVIQTSKWYLHGAFE